ncbi:MAG: peptide chain release factor N(5)-glutamine methyltransferase [Candidatus Goldiibacteriota bacterium]|jgi:release factor glutamine methyltransferase
MTFSEAIFNSSKKLFKRARSRFKARLEAELLMMNAAGFTREKLYMSLRDAVPVKILKKFKKTAVKRSLGFPLQLITGRESFFGRDFAVKNGVLIPRQDSEALINAVLSAGAKLPPGAIAADCGSGSGILAITLLKELPAISKFHCFDISSRAINLTAANAGLHGVASRIGLIKGDFIRLAPLLRTKFDLIVSNPPYIKKSGLKSLQKEVLFDPLKALSDGGDGYGFYRKFALICPALINNNGFMAVEIGNKMGNGVRSIFLKAGWKQSASFNDASCRERALIFTPPQNQR